MIYLLKQPIYVEFNLDAKVNNSKLIAISHVDDKYSETLEVAVKQNDRFVYMGGANVVARMVLHREKDYLLSDSVPCTVNANGNILIPFDNAVVKTLKGIVKIEVSITRDTDELTLQFPLWVSVNGSILDNAEVTPESEGTIPDLLKEAADALEENAEALQEAAQALIDVQAKGYDGAYIDNGDLYLIPSAPEGVPVEPILVGHVVGRDGVGITRIWRDEYNHLWVQKTTGMMTDLGVIQGDGYANAEIDANGDLLMDHVLGNGLVTPVNLGHVVGAKGDPGDDYVLTAQDKADIADIVLSELQNADTMTFPIASEVNDS